MALAQTKTRVFAFNLSTGSPVTGDAANITARWSKDYATPVAITDVNPTEAESGFYYFTLSTDERTVSIIGEIFPESSTTDVQVIGVPAYFITSNTGQFVIKLTIKAANGTIVSYCDVTITEENTGESDAVVTSGASNSVGKVEFKLNSGTYYGWRNKTDYTFTDPFMLTVESDGTFSVS